MKKQKSFLNEKNRGFTPLNSCLPSEIVPKAISPGRANLTGFTLAEILLVAGIVALIGSIILIFSKGAIEKAKIAKLLNFSAQIHHALGAYLIAEYKFEETGDNTCPNPFCSSPGVCYDDFCDTSGNGNHGRNAGDVSRAPNTKIPQLGQTGSFPVGYNAYIDIWQSDSLVSDSGFITVQAWIKLEEFSSDPRAIVGKLNYGWWFFLKGKKLCWSFDADDIRQWPEPSLCSNEVFEKGKWYHVVGTLSKSKVKLFVNTEEIFSELHGQNFQDYGGVGFGIGMFIFNEGFTGYIDEVRVYGETFSSS